MALEISTASVWGKFMYKVGIECESLEGESWGVGRNTLQFLKVVARRPELANKYQFQLYFKNRVPEIAILQNPLFIKHIVSPRWLKSFSVYYYVLLPIRATLDRVSAMYFPNYMLPIIYFGKSISTLTNDLYYETWNSRLPFRYRLAYMIFGYWAAWFATAIMSVSNSAADDVARLYKIDRKRVFGNPLGVNVPSDSETTNYQLKTKNYLLYLGQAFPRRHLRETILAFEKIAKEFPEYKLIAIGKDNYRPLVIKQLIKEVNQRLGGERVIHHDYVDEKELASYYAGAKLFIYVSNSEAFGLPPLEALAHGVPPVVSNQPVNREIYGSPEEEGAFFVNDPDNVYELAAVIKLGLVDQAARENILAQREKILERYTWEKHTDRLLKLIDHVIEKNA